MDAGTENLIGRFLRARRELLQPEDVGLPAGVRRRVAGLRREEVARIADVSTDYYVRLEQGRERHPSAQVVEALARALRLEDDATVYLHQLARSCDVTRGERPAEEEVSPNLLRMMDAWEDTPAMIIGRYLTVLASNTLGRALFDGFSYSDDLLRSFFLDPRVRDFYPDWEQSAPSLVASLRGSIGTDHDDPRFIELVGELSLKSETFRQLWARHDVQRKRNATKRFRHPLVGELTLRYEAFTVNSAPSQQLVIYQAEPGSPSEEALSLLGSLATTSPERLHEP
jgi:transcriptional regulator with XRE-family HTH domain